MRRCSLRVPASGADLALLRMLEWFPEGVEERSEGDEVVLSGYAAEPPAPGLEVEEVEDGWADAWRDFHHPVRIGRLWVGPPWCEPQPPAVVIDPGHAFGTGGHGSTRAALELLQTLEPCPALDLGCGSGVLSIAASVLGFGPLRAYDLDPLAVRATADNAGRNGVPVDVEQLDVLTGPLLPAPLWLANLQLDLLERLLERSDVPPLLLASGLLASQTLGGSRRAVVDGWAAELVLR
ncbi:MAG: 50S ribosomal protein L11 methyltransferase [Gaiellales bacterium]